MKKLMIAAVAIAAGVAFADDGSSITSKNIVGYTSEEMAENGTQGGFSFVMVGGTETMPLTNLTVTGYSGNISSGFEIQRLDDLGGTKETYIWHDYKNKKGTFYGWFHVQSNTYVKDLATPVIFSAGEGAWIWVSGDGIGCKLQCNGQVLTASRAIPLQNNGLMLANPYPMDIPVTNLWASGYTGNISSGIELQMLDDLGGTATTFQWHDFKNKKGTFYGWFWIEGNKYVKDATAAEQATFKFGLGKAFWAWCTMETGTQYYINFPEILK